MDTNLRDVLDDPARRRFWLLTKALEGAPLREALALAKGAEAFLTRSTGALPERVVADYSTTFQLPKRMH
jgi:hypothetical protein